MATFYTCARITWKAVRAERIIKLRLLVAGLTGFVFLLFFEAASSLHADITQRVITRAVATVIRWLGELAPIVGEQKVKAAAGRSPGLAVLVVGLIAGWLRSRTAAIRLHDVLFATFNYDVLRPVSWPQALDPLWGGAAAGCTPAMLWLNPLNGPRREAWERLNNFIDHDAGDGRIPLLWWRHRSSFEPVIWAVLTGQAGAGKTRMAVELARARGRRELLGNGTTYNDPPQRRRNQRNLQMGAWVRRIWPTAARLSSDPWDAGWLSFNDPAGRVPAWEKRHNVDDVWLQGLAEWRPARPTVLLLDDPLPGDTSAVVRALRAQGERYLHPVRLLIVSQTVPSDLKLQPEVMSGGVVTWTSAQAGFTGEVVALTSQEALTEHDIRALAAGARLPLAVWRGRDVEVCRFHRATRGNALLTELGFAWLREGKPLDMLTRSTLIEDRARRIVAALTAAGLGSDNHLHALAVATLAGGCAGIAGQAERETVLAALDKPDFPREALRRVFSLEQTDVSHLPPVRPELIGDGFVRYVLRQAPDDPELSRRISAQAWRAGP